MTKPLQDRGMKIEGDVRSARLHLPSEVCNLSASLSITSHKPL